MMSNWVRWVCVAVTLGILACGTKQSSKPNPASDSDCGASSGRASGRQDGAGAREDGAGAPEDGAGAREDGGVVVDPPFQPPPTATPAEGWKVDHGLSSYTTKVYPNSSTFIFDKYNWQSKYFDLEFWNYDNDSRITPSATCVIYWTDREGTNCVPTTIALYALQKYSQYVADTPDAAAARDRFLVITDWFVDNQDENGGWPFNYESDWDSQRAAKLQPGWYGGMAQGLIISSLVRAFYLTEDVRYLDAARRAVGVLRTPVEQGGVMRHVSGHVFYEEYPTTPMSNVLNGFIFSLIGLYDLSQLTSEPIYDEYFNEGVATIHAVISQYDLGAFTSYDLSHLQHPGMAPNRASWGYHSLHVSQLSWLRVVTGDEAFFTPLVDRWSGYLNNEQVPSN